MRFLKSFFSRFTSLVTLYRIYSQVNAAFQAFPGLENEIKLRAWLLENLAILSRLALQTTNTIDDAMTLSMARLIENDTAWKVLTRMIDVAQPLLENEGEMTPQIQYYSHSLEEIDASLNEEQPVENPILILSAVGLLLQIIQLLRSRLAK